MNRNLISSFLLLGIFSLALGCGGSKKAEDGASDQDSIEPQALAYDPMGSDGGNIPGLSSINFEYDKATLTSSARQTLADNANWLNQNSNVSIQIEGHCDSRGSSEYNLALGERRANSVKSYLVSLGVDGQRLSVVSYGKEKPLDSMESESAWSKNRRANFVPLAR